MKVINEQKVNEIRGKMLFNAATQDELYQFLNYVNAIEALVEEASDEDYYGSKGYQHRLGWD